MILRSFICSGIPYPDEHNLGQTGAITINLMEHFLGKVCKVYTDNYYNPVKLTEFMSATHTYVTGTLNKYRKKNPPMVIKSKLKKGEAK